jgi:hypothetical protein
MEQDRGQRTAGEGEVREGRRVEGRDSEGCMQLRCRGVLRAAFDGL